MAKLIESPINADDLAKYATTADDFRFELDVFKVCLMWDHKAQHGGTYQDPVSNRDRQFDIRMEVTEGSCRIKMAVECKNLKPYYPLVVSRVPRRREEAFHDVFFLTPSAFHQHRYQRGNEFYPKLAPVGKDTNQVGKRKDTRDEMSPWVTDDKEVYEKWAQAIASAHDLIIHSMPESDAEIKQHDDYLATAVLPILVVPDGTLWAIDYDSNGILASPPSPVLNCTLYLGKEYLCSRGRWAGRFKISHLNIFTFLGFEAFLKGNREELMEELFPKPFPPKDLGKLPG